MANLTIKDAFKALENIDIEIIETPKKKVNKLSEAVKTKKLKEAEESEQSKVADFIKDAVERLKKEEATNYKYDLDGLLGLFVGWSAGYGEEKRDDCIQSEENPDYAINVGIKVKNPADWTDFDMLNFPYHENGEVEDLSISIEPDEDYNKLAQYVLEMYDNVRDLDIDDDGLIQEEDKLSLKGKIAKEAQPDPLDDEIEEPLKEEKLQEKNWRYSLKSGLALRKAIKDEDFEEIKKQLLNCYKELFKNQLIAEDDYDTWTEEIIDSDFDTDDEVDYHLSNLYDLCDGINVWVELFESKKPLSNKKIDSIAKRNQKYLDRIKIKPNSKSVEVEIPDNSKVGDEGHPIQQGLRGRTSKLEAVEEPTDMKSRLDKFVNKDMEIEESCEVKEDTIKQNGKWVNKGKKGTHGTFKTKKTADAQRKAMFAKGYKEGCELKEEPQLEPIHDGRKSFYGKADWHEEQDGTKVLYSYDTKVCEITPDGKVKLLSGSTPLSRGYKVALWRYSPTTLRHVKEFLRQNGFKADSVKQMEKDYLGESLTEKQKFYYCVYINNHPCQIYDTKEEAEEAVDELKAESNEKCKIVKINASEKDYIENDITSYGESLTEGTLININDDEEVKKSIEELEKPVEAEATEKIVDVDADTVEKIKDSYIGNVILQCPVCRTLVYKEPDKLVKDEETELYNLEDECPHCGSVDGYELVGQVAKADVEVEDEESEDEESEEVKPEELPVEEPVEEVESDEEEIKFESLDTDKLDTLLNRYMHEVYSNIDNYTTTSANIDDENNQIIVEGKIKFNSGKEKSTKFVFEAHLKTIKGKYKFKGLNETFSKNKSFTLTTTIDNNMLIPESFWYNYNINQLNESKQIKGSVRL